MDIVMIGPTAPYKGGISQFTTLLSQELAKKHNVTFYSWKRQYPRFVNKEQRDPNAKQNRKARFTLSWNNPFSWLATSIRIAKAKPDILVYPWLTPFHGPIYWCINTMVKLFSSKTRILYVCHNVMPHEPHAADHLLTKFGFAYADGFMVHAKEERKQLAHVATDAKHVLGYHPILDVYKTLDLSQVDIARFKAQLGIQGQRVILFFGFVRPYKGLRYLLDAMPAVDKDAVLLIAGEFWGDKRPYLDQIAKNKIGNRVIIKEGYIPEADIQRYFSAADLVVLPYVSATQSGPAQIAYAFDKPLVCTAVGGLKEVIDEGKTGYLIKPKQPQEIAKAVNKTLARLKEDPRAFDRSIQEIKQRFGWKRYAELLLSLAKDAP